MVCKTPKSIDYNGLDPLVTRGKRRSIGAPKVFKTRIA